MAREPQTRPQQTATPLASPLQKRSQYLAQALAEMSKEPQRIAGYGDLGARLLAQAITQSASEKTDKALGAEAANAELARRRAIASGVGIEVPGEMQEVGSGRLGNPIAPILRAGRNLFGGGEKPAPPPTQAMAQAPAQVMPPAMQPNAPMAPVPPVENGGALPPVGMMPPQQDPPQVMPAQAQPMSQQQAGPPPMLVQQVERLLAQGTPEAYAQAEAIVQDYQQREMILASLTPEQRANSDFVFAALYAPDKLAESVGYQWRPQVIQPGAIQSVVGSGERVSAPQTIQFGDTLTRVDPLSPTPQTIATRGPTIAENLKAEELRQPRPLVVGQGGAVASFNTTTGETEIEVERAPAAPQGNIMERLAPQERGMITQASTQASQARGRIRDAERFQTLNRERGTGPLAGFAGPILANDPLYAEMRQLESKLTPREREPGSGPMSDRDIVLYNRAIPRLGNPGPTNDAVVTAAVAMSQRDIEYAAFLEEWAMRNGTLLGSTESWQQYVEQNPLLEEQRGGGISLRQGVTPWRTYFGYGDQQQRGSAQQGGGPARVASDDDYARLPSGTVFVGPDGVERRKP
jgi:hypothetical protein